MNDADRSAPEVVAEYTNSEGERVSIERVTVGPFVGRFLLVLHDDPPLFFKAPMLLDAGTANWLQTFMLDHQGEIR